MLVLISGHTQTIRTRHSTHQPTISKSKETTRITQSRSPNLTRGRRRSKFERNAIRDKARTYPPPAQPVVRRVLVRYVEGVVEDLLLHQLGLRGVLRGASTLVRRADLRRRRTPQRHAARSGTPPQPRQQQRQQQLPSLAGETTPTRARAREPCAAHRRQRESTRVITRSPWGAGKATGREANRLTSASRSF